MCVHSPIDDENGVQEYEYLRTLADLDDHAARADGVVNTIIGDRFGTCSIGRLDLWDTMPKNGMRRVFTWERSSTIRIINEGHAKRACLLKESSLAAKWATLPNSESSGSCGERIPQQQVTLNYILINS